MPSMPKAKYKPKQVGQAIKSQKPKNWLADPTTEHIYHSPRWRKLRAYVLQNKPVCVMCTRAAKFLDHITPISQGGAIWDEDNLQGLCIKCNASKTAKDRYKK
jgi:5-methylcytosine-specific restriction endonuclease McrA